MKQILKSHKVHKIPTYVIFLTMTRSSLVIISNHESLLGKQTMYQTMSGVSFTYTIVSLTLLWSLCVGCTIAQ